MSTPYLARSDDKGRRYYPFGDPSESYWSVTTIINGGVPKYLGPYYSKHAAELAFAALVERGPYSRSSAIARRLTAAGRADFLERQARGELKSLKLEKQSDRDLALRWIKGAADRHRDAAGARGIAVHHEAEQVVLEYARDAARLSLEGERLKPWPEAIASYQPGFVGWVNDFRPEFLAAEATVFNGSQAYAGTLDTIITIRAGDLVDAIRKNGDNPAASAEAAAIWAWLISLPADAPLVLIIDFKRLALDTPLPTPTGWTTVGEVKVGDQVLDETGRPCNVTGLSVIRSDEDCYRIRWEDGATVIAGADHPWLIGSQGRQRIMTTLELATRVRRNREAGNQRAYWIDVAGAMELDHVDLPIDPYVLGAWLGDGSSRSGEMTAHRDDADHWIEKFGDVGYRTSGPRTDRRNSNVVALSFPELRRRLADNGLIGNKHIPSAYLRASRGQRLALLQGLMDTDGTVRPARQFRASFTQKRPAVVEGFVELVRGLGMRVGDGHLLRSGSRMFEFTATMPVFRLPRKAALLAMTPKQAAIARRRMVLSVERAPNVPTRCISVDSPSHLYLCTEHFVATHNTGRAIYADVALQLSAYSRHEFIGHPDRVTPLPAIAAQLGAVLHLRADGTYRFHLVRIDDAIFNAFKFAREVFRFQEETSRTVFLQDLTPRPVEPEPITTEEVA